ncbi:MULTISPECIES: hypothetical protein [unclassified Bradyrhizobium]|nr:MULTISPECIES: hypothetical protein [unclassified Bradyrhizobium]
MRLRERSERAFAGVIQDDPKDGAAKTKERGTGPRSFKTDIAALTR